MSWVLVVLDSLLRVYRSLHSGPIRGRMTDTDGSGETPYPSSGPDGIGGPTTPSVILIRRLRMGFVPEKTKKTPIRTDGISVSKPPIRHPDRMV
jgi:hypothetical protein